MPEVSAFLPLKCEGDIPCQVVGKWSPGEINLSER